MPFEIIDADGHVSESWEQLQKYLEPPYNRRPVAPPYFPQDGWDRRLRGTLGHWAGDAKSWLEAMDQGGMELSVLFPTLGLFLPFLRDPEWAVALAKAGNGYNNRN